jgi:tetratricopeptide (TPR) repeat protein
MNDAHLIGFNGRAVRRGLYLWGLFACLLMVFLSSGCVKKDVIVYKPTQQDVSRISYPDAKNTARQLWMTADTKYTYKVNFSKNFVTLIMIYSADAKALYVWDLKKMTDPYVTSDYCVNSDRGFSHTHHYKEKIHHYTYGVPMDSLSRATAFANALYVLKHGAEAAERAAEVEFADKAKKYREMPVKPPLPEGAQRSRIMAEDAINNKEFEKAAEYYEQGLEIEPLWPEGQFNAALLYGELKDYENASLHMKHYLELVPNARDAREAREKMYLWEGKAREERTK